MELQGEASRAAGQVLTGACAQNAVVGFVKQNTAALPRHAVPTSELVQNVIQRSRDACHLSRLNDKGPQGESTHCWFSHTSAAAVTERARRKGAGLHAFPVFVSLRVPALWLQSCHQATPQHDRVAALQ